MDEDPIHVFPLERHPLQVFVGGVRGIAGLVPGDPFPASLFEDGPRLPGGKFVEGRGDFEPPQELDLPSQRGLSEVTKVSDIRMGGIRCAVDLLGVQLLVEGEFLFEGQDRERSTVEVGQGELVLGGGGGNDLQVVLAPGGKEDGHAPRKSPGKLGSVPHALELLAGLKATERAVGTDPDLLGVVDVVHDRMQERELVDVPNSSFQLMPGEHSIDQPSTVRLCHHV